MSDRPDRGANAGAIRGDIQAGATGDKRPGFDPAAAPLETDGEAGGNGMTAEEVNLARRATQAPAPDRSALGYGNAMRPTELQGDGAEGPRLPRYLLPGLAVMVIVVLLFWLLG